MPRDSSVPGSAQDWLARAKGDLALARVSLPDGAFLEDLCFHTQQAAEKALKAVFCHSSLKFRFTHDLDELITGLIRNGIDVPVAVVESDALTGFAWEARYPGLAEPVTLDEYHEAIRQAETVVDWAATIIER